MFFSKLFNAAAAYIMLAAILSIAQQDIKKKFAVRRITPRSPLKFEPAPVLSAYNTNPAATSNGTVILTPTDFDHGYLTPITIGGQIFNVAFDTGSNFLWVFSSQIPSSNHKAYDPSKSSTSKQAGSKWEVCYDGERCCTGDLFIETVSVGGINIDGQAVGAATAVNNADFLNEGFDGILGLSFHQRSIGKVPNSTFLDNIEAELPSPLFTVDLKKGKPGSCDFGFVDESKFIGKITYVPVDSSQGDWVFDVNGYTIGTGSPSSISINAIADTGTTFAFLPPSIVDAFYAAVPGAFFDSNENLYAFACGSTLPSITFDIGTYKAVLPGSFIESVPTNDNSTNCLGAIQISRQPDTFILGSVFLKSQFVVFKGGSDPSIGFAAKPL